MESIFGAYDVRGIFGKDLTLDKCELIGKAVGTLIDSDEFVIGYDTREHSPKVYEAFVKGITSTGLDVVSVGMVPNPVAYFTGFNNKLPGAYITASHNPPEYNGIKFFHKDGTSFVNELQKIKEIANSNKFKEGAGNVAEVDYAITDYEEYLYKRITIDKKMKIAAECFNGSSALILKQLLNYYDIELTPLNMIPKGDFGGLRPEPKGANLENLKKAVLDNKSDFGIAFDGDSDRGVFIDDKGKEYMADIPSIIFIKDILSKTKGKIIAAADCPTEIGKIVEENGGSIHWTRVGHSFIEEAVVKEKALYGFEQSSHFYFKTFYPFSDGFLAMLRMAEILSKSNENFSSIADKIKINPMEKFYIKCNDHQHKKTVMQKIREEFPEGKDYADGIKIMINDVEWALIRTSQTNPEININIEAKNEKRLKELVKKYSKIVEEKING